MPRTLSRRVTDSPPYLFAELDKAEQAARARGIDVIRLSIGDPDLPSPPFVIEDAARRLSDSKYHRYPPYRGTSFFTENIIEYMNRRFGVELTPENVLCLIGAKEGIAHLTFGVVDPGGLSIHHEPGYMVASIISGFAGGEAYFRPLLPSNGFLLDYHTIPADVTARANILWVNHPGNPTGAVAPKEYYDGLVEWAQKNDVWLGSDLAYSENYYGIENRPASLLAAPGAMDCAIEFHSFSKIFNMTGWRIGWACGNAELVGALAAIKSNLDTSQFGAIADAAAAGLNHPDASGWMSENRERMRARRDMVCGALRECGIEVTPPAASLYVWSPLPPGVTDSIAFAAELLEKTGVLIAPGRGYGPSGEGFFRISLTYAEAELEEAMRRLREYLRK
ncbi:MAG: aminotransferase class I/II-fold pyridoxal phosphate-dependent enzyme [bacterium]|jgi:LL-diaminopimelate aminotransferase